MSQPLEQTWDGLPIAPDPPHGATIVVRRPGEAGPEYLMQHRAHHGPDYDGDWAWTPPSGARQPGEPILAGAMRELAEEAGITEVRLRPVDLSGEWAIFGVDVPSDAPVVLADTEHDGFEWLVEAEAIRRCRPEHPAAVLRRAAAVRHSQMAFRPMARADLPDLLSWMAAPAPG